MDTAAFIELSTELVKNLIDWSEEVHRLDILTTEQLEALHRTVEIIEHATTVAVPIDPNRAA